MLKVSDLWTFWLVEFGLEVLYWSLVSSEQSHLHIAAMSHCVVSGRSAVEVQQAGL